MIKPLRTYHYYLWRIWVVLLPLGFILALWVIPENQVKEVSATAPIPATGLVSYLPSEDYEVNLRRADHTYQLELILKKPLTVPACLVYIHTDQDLLIGQLSQVGTYEYDLPADISKYKKLEVTLRDPIHQQTLTTIPLPL